MAMSPLEQWACALCWLPTPPASLHPVSGEVSIAAVLDHREDSDHDKGQQHRKQERGHMFSNHSSVASATYACFGLILINHSCLKLAVATGLSDTHR